MKELLSSKPGKIAVKVLTWGVISFVISAGGSTLLLLAVNFGLINNSAGLFKSLYGIFYYIGIVTFFLLAASMITLRVMTIAKYRKRNF
jgi:hypothetical protein